MKFKFKTILTPPATFDSLKMKRKVVSFEKKWLFKIGGAIRLISKRSMKRRNGSSSPGKPPSVHAGQLKDLIFFALVQGETAVWVGPTLFSGSGNTYNVPNLHEFGGVVMRKITGRKGTKDRMKAVRYPKRPFMKPALEPAIKFLEKKGEIPKIFAQAVL